MHKFWILTRLQLSSLFGVNKIRHQKEGDEKKKGQRSLRTLIVMAVALLYISVMYGGMLASALREIGALPLMLGLMATGASLMVLIYSVFEAKSVLFTFGDYDMILSWPVTVAQVAASRVACMMAYNLVYGALLLLPAGVIYALYAAPPLWYYPLLLLVTLLLPAVPTLLGALLGTLLTAATARMKKNSVVNTVFQFALMIVLVAAIMRLNMGLADIGGTAVSLSGGIGRVYPPVVWLQNALCGDMAQLLWLTLVSVFAAAALTALLCACFTKVHGMLSDRPHGKRFSMGRQNRSGRVRALYRKDWRRYLASSVYVTNTAFGYVMLLAAGVAAVAVQNETFRTVLAAPEMQKVLAAVPLFIGVLMSMSATTGCSISIEGKQFWIIRTLPVPARELFLSKILVSLTLAVPSVLVCSTLIGIGLKLHGTVWIWLYVTPLVCALFAAVFGLWVNLRLPRLDWQNETEVVKQSAALAVSLFGGMAFIIVPAVAAAITGLTWISGAAAVLLLAAAALFWRSLTRHGEEKLLAI